MKLFKKIFLIITIFCLIAIVTCCFIKPIKNIVKSVGLVFNDSDEFTILHLTDLHEILHKKNNLNEENIKFFKDAIINNKPDLVILGGDNIFPVSLLGELTQMETLNTIRAIYKIFDEFNQPWTIVFGNHDDEAVYDKTAQYKVCIESENFVGGFEDNIKYEQFVDKDNDMVANVKIPIYDSNGLVKFNIFTLDSGSYRKTGFPTTVSPHYWYNYIRQSQINWYINEAGQSIPNIVFTHIPLHEFDEYYAKIKDKAYVVESKGEFGGYMLSDTRSNFFPRAIENTNIKGIFTGHMHENSLTMLCKTSKQNIILSTTKKVSDYNYEYQKHGNARVIKIKQDGGLSTYEYTEGAEFNLLEYK